MPLQPKELVHLIQAGALDGLAASRAALLAEIGEIKHGGSTFQMAFDFAEWVVPAESATQRLAWETEVLGWPVSVHPLDTVRAQIGQAVGLLGQCAAHPRQPVTVAGARMPGWTGGDGFFLGDGRTYAIVKAGKDTEPPRAVAAAARARPLGRRWLGHLVAAG